MSKALRPVEFQVTVTFDGGSGIAVDVAMELTAREYTTLVDCCAEGKEINQYWGLGKLSRRIETIAKEKAQKIRAEKYWDEDQDPWLDCFISFPDEVLKAAEEQKQKIAEFFVQNHPQTLAPTCYWEYYNREYTSCFEFTVEDGVISSAARLPNISGNCCIIPKGVTRIGRIFPSGTWIRTLVIPEGVTEIEDHAFSNTRVEEVLLPQSLQRIGVGAFSGGDFLRSINVPAHTEIGAYAFSGSGLPVDSKGFLIINDTLIKYEAHQFSTRGNHRVKGRLRCSELVVPEGIRVLGAGAITNGDLTKIKLPSSLEEIQKDNFCYLPKLEELTIPASVKKIGDGCFCHLDLLPRVSFAGEIPELGRGLFKHCPGFPFEDGLFIWRDTLYWRLPSRRKSVKVPAHVKAIDAGAFRNDSYSDPITQVSLPEGLTRIEDGLFKDCAELKQVKLPKSLKAIGARAFDSCYKLPVIAIPKGVTEIGEGAFANCRELETVTIPEGVSRIEDHTFHMCLKLREVAIPHGVTHIGRWAFRSCPLQETRLPETLISIDSCAFDSGKFEHVHIPDSVRFLADYVFSPCLKSVRLPESVEIDPHAFAHCKALADEKGFIIVKQVLHGYCGTDEEVVVPEGVVTIPEKVFTNGYNDFRTLRLPNTLKNLSPYALSSCLNLMAVTFPEHMKDCRPEDFGAPPLVHWKCPSCSQNWENRGSMSFCPKCHTRGTETH